jgi:hypothetical protein
MKLLMFDTNDFWYKTFSKTVESAETCTKEESTTDSLVIFINVEKEDEAQKDKVVKKAVDNISWLAKKTDRKKVVLHSFGHLSESNLRVSRVSSSLKTPLKQSRTNSLQRDLKPQ